MYYMVVVFLIRKYISAIPKKKKAFTFLSIHFGMTFKMKITQNGISWNEFQKI